MSNYRIDDKQELKALLGEANDFVKGKVATELDEDMKSFIARSSLIFLSTIDNQGNPDVSPKGDPAGFVKVQGNQLVIPDRPGNKLLYGFNNILDNPAIGLIFVVPNERETLRVKGKAWLSNDPALLESMAVKNKPAVLATCVDVEECFFHCGKAMIRSGMWNPESWPEPGKNPIVKQITRQMDGDAGVEEMIQTEIDKNYRDELY